MSWDVTFMRTPGYVNSLNDIPTGFDPPSLGNRSEVVTRLSEALSGFDFSNKWGVYTGPDHSLVLNLVCADDPEMVQLAGAQVRGGNGALDTLKLIWQSLHCSAFDDGTGDRIDNNADPGIGFRAWRRYKNAVLHETEESTQE